MPRNFLRRCGLALSALVISAFAQSGSISDENAQIERQAALLGLHRNLHSSTHFFQDGSKGIKLGSAIHEPYFDEMYPPPGIGPEEVRLHKKICSSATILIAKQIGSTSFLTPNKVAIYTRHEFRIIRVLRSKEPMPAGKLIDVLRLGGALTDEGETLKMELEDSPLYSANGTYLLFLRHPVTSTRDELFAPQDRSDMFQIVSGKLSLKKSSAMAETTLPFVSGEDTADIVRLLAAVEQKLPCK